MTSGKQARRKRQVPPPPVRSTSGGRKANTKVLVFVGVGLLCIAAAIGLVFAFSGGNSSESSTPTALPDANVVNAQFAGIPQKGNVLGSAKAPVTLLQYIDLQCPVCRAFETEVMPTILRRYVRTGKVKVETRPIAFIGPDSQTGLRGSVAAANQDGMAQFNQLLYFNQGPENGGWLNDDIVQSAAASIPGMDLDQFNADRESSETADAQKRYATQANQDGVTGTPAVYVGPSGGKLAAVAPNTLPTVEDVSAAIDKAQK
jgi:protein-disulfide isomerase